MKLRRTYSSYKPSLVPCLDEVPTHWDNVLLKYYFDENKEKNKGNIEDHILTLSYGRIKSKKGKENYGLLPESFETYQIINPGYLVFRFTDLQNDQKSLRVGYSSLRGIITSAYLGLSPKSDEVNSKFYYYLFHALDIKKYFYGFGGGVRLSLDWKTLSKIKYPKPSFEEQTAIANFLDKKTTEIKRFIELKEKTIELLKERKTAIINQAVTKGLDPNVEMKDSGIEWLGEIPAHWEVKKLKYVANVVNGATPKSDDLRYWNGDITWLTPEDISPRIGELISDSKRKITYLGLNSCGTTLVPPKSIIATTRAPIGNVCMAGDLLCTNQGCKSIVLKNNDLSSKYVMYYLIALKENLETLGRGTTFMELSTTSLKGFPIVYSSNLDEIESIVDLVTNKIDEINNSITLVEREISLIKEYRESLISEAVTGKIDVREAIEEN